ncbi:hypothetical protein ABE527_14620 [Brucella sp. TWI432]
MTFFEDLPAQCPPAAAADVPYQQIWRVVADKNCNADEFKSHHARGQKKPPTVDECSYASCSLLTDFQKIKKLAKGLPKKRYPKPFIAELNIPMGSGLSVNNSKTSHVDFWMFKSFDPVSAIVQIVEA